MDKLTGKLTEADVEFKLIAEMDEIPVRGNAQASGDDEDDRRVEDEILERLDRGDVWAWASVTVEAHYQGLVGRDHLGGCNYADEKDFCQPGGYYDDMKSEALADLQKRIDTKDDRQIGEHFRELVESSNWRVEAEWSAAHGYTVTLHDTSGKMERFIYRGEDLRALLARAWAGEPPDHRR